MPRDLPASPPAPVHLTVAAVTARIEARSQATRQTYLDTLARAKKPGPYRRGLGCANAAHAYAAMPESDKHVLRQERQPNLAIVSAYNDMLSAHRPYEHYPEVIRAAARERGATAQVAAGVPAMCDGINQGQDGMELSLFSRDVIALATAVGLSHPVFDAVLLLGICDKIVPGLFIGALQAGHLPAVFVPAGPMTSGLANDAKARVRQQYAQGLVDREALMQAEMAAYHGPGTCTFYGTANSNQMLMEVMGLHLPGASFVTPGTPLREALTRAAVQCALERSQTPGSGMGHQIDAKVMVNAIVGLLATGGSTNHTLHLVAMGRAAGWCINWDDFSDLSSCVPLLAHIYPNGSADINQFQAAGGMGFLIGQLLQGGLLHNDVQTLLGQGLHRYAAEPWLNPARGGALDWRDSPTQSGDESILRPLQRPFSPNGGLQLVCGNLGRAVVKVSAVQARHQRVSAPAVVVDDPQTLIQMFQQGLLERDFVAVVRHQGPQANGMPELHQLTPLLGALQGKGFQVALVTDGRMSGASGKVPAAIHVSPEAAAGGRIGKVQTGDWVTLDCTQKRLQVEVAEAEWANRPTPSFDATPHQHGTGRELFALFRCHAGSAETGASPLFGPGEC